MAILPFLSLVVAVGVGMIVFLYLGKLFDWSVFKLMDGAIRILKR